MSTESTQITPSSPTLSQIGSTPKTVGIVVNFSRQLSLQSNAENFIRRELMRSIGTAVDQAIISGSGVEQPIGILNTSGINSVTGTSFDMAAAVSMKRKVADANADDSTISYLTTPSVRELLENREKTLSTGNGFIWDNDIVAGKPANVSTDVPSATLICGSFPKTYPLAEVTIGERRGEAATENSYRASSKE